MTKMEYIEGKHPPFGRVGGRAPSPAGNSRRKRGCAPSRAFREGALPNRRHRSTPLYAAGGRTFIFRTSHSLTRTRPASPREWTLARPIAKRRAGLLASPDGGEDSLLFASGCGPVRFDFDCSLFSGHESEAADRSVRSTQTNPPDAPPIHA
jgi:hypothetical protein